MKKFLGLLVAALAAVTLVGCNKVKASGTFVVSYSDFSEKFSPFYAETAYDVDVYGMTQVSLLSATKNGEIITKTVNGADGVDPDGNLIKSAGYTAADGQNYKGIATVDIENIGKTDGDGDAEDNYLYTFNLRRGVKFTNGETLTVDDVLFNIYVLVDPSYSGASTLYSVPIKGLAAYQAGTTDSALVETANGIFDKVVAKYYVENADADATYTVAADDGFAQSDYDFVKSSMDAGWEQTCDSICSYVQSSYASYVSAGYGGLYSDTTKYPSPFSIEGFYVAYGMRMWGFGSWEKDADKNYTGKFKCAVDGQVYDLSECTLAFMAKMTKLAYEGVAFTGDGKGFFEVESTSTSYDFVAGSKTAYVAHYVSEHPSDSSVYAISGIKKINNYKFTIETTEFSAVSIYQFALTVAPLSYYGDKDSFHYSSDSKACFGFPKADLSLIKAKTTQPLGAGAYIFKEFKDGVVYFEANANYYSGSPAIKYVQFREAPESEFVSSVATGLADMSTPSYSVETAKTISAYNSNKETSGDVLTTKLVDNNGYGYIGINANTVNVGGDPSSTASKNLRKAFATLFSVYRDEVVNSYYGDAASVINYPVSNSSWAAPQATDQGYEVAYSKDVAGKAIYTSSMSSAEKYAAALVAAKGYLEAAGYTFVGSVATAPAGAKTEYEVIIGGGGSGDHPSYQILVQTKNALATLGITLTINDPADTNVLWDALDAGTQEMWCAAWQSTVDPDMYQVYYSTNIIENVGKAGVTSTGSNHYHIQDAELDSLILAGRKSPDSSARKPIYKQCFEIILDWAVEIPVYQRQNAYLFSSTRIDLTTLPKTLTPYWGPLSEIDKIKVISE